MDATSKNQEVLLKRIHDRIARKLATRDCDKAGMEIPEQDHELWGVWNDSASTVVEEINPELKAFIEYEHAINWMTTCTSCAKTLDSAYKETIRKELAELTLKEISEWATNTRFGNAASEVKGLLENGAERASNTMKEKE